MTESTRRMKLIAWATVACYILVAVSLTHMPKVPAGIEQGGDKILHGFGYFLYASLTYIAIGLTFPRYRWAVLTVVLLLSMWAALDEITQPYFHRDCDFNDWLADMAGVITAVSLLGSLRLIARFRDRPLVPSPGTPGEG